MNLLKWILLLMLNLLLWGAACFVSGYFLMNALPCDWFGSTTEGACGYTIFYLYILAASGLTIALSVACVLVVKKRLESRKES